MQSALGCSIFTCVRNIDITIRTYLRHGIFCWRVEEFTLLKELELSVSLPVANLVFQGLSVLIWNNMLEHTSNTIKVAIIDKIWSKMCAVVTRLQKRNVISWEAVTGSKVVDVLHVRTKMFIILIDHIHSGLVNKVIKSSREEPNRFARHVHWRVNQTLTSCFVCVISKHLIVNVLRCLFAFFSRVQLSASPWITRNNPSPSERF